MCVQRRKKTNSSNWIQSESKSSFRCVHCLQSRHHTAAVLNWKGSDSSSDGFAGEKNIRKAQAMVLTLTKVSQRPTVKPTWGELNAFAMDTRWKTTKSSVTSRTVRECVGIKKQNERKAEEKSFEGGEGGPSFRLELPINHHSRQHLSPSSIPASTQLLSSFVSKSPWIS